MAKTVQGLAEKMQAAEKVGDANATASLADLKQVAQDIDDEQMQLQKLLLAIHDFVGSVAQTQQASAAEEKPPLLAPGHEPHEEDGTPTPGQSTTACSAGCSAACWRGMFGDSTVVASGVPWRWG